MLWALRTKSVPAGLAYVFGDQIQAEVVYIMGCESGVPRGAFGEGLNHGNVD